jgi:hypothetical protein
MRHLILSYFFVHRYRIPCTRSPNSVLTGAFVPFSMNSSARFRPYKKITLPNCGTARFYANPPLSGRRPTHIFYHLEDCQAGLESAWRIDAVGSQNLALAAHLRRAHRLAVRAGDRPPPAGLAGGGVLACLAETGR